jgi:hypothetical protein
VRESYYLPPEGDGSALLLNATASPEEPRVAPCGPCQGAALRPRAHVLIYTPHTKFRAQRRRRRANMQAGFLKKEAVVAAIPAEALEAKFERCLSACAALRSKPADEEEPYVFRYEERDALQQMLKQAAANAAVDPDGANAARARVVGGVLECWLGINFMDTEEPGSGQARLERAIEALDIEKAPAEAVRLLDALNHLGILWANRGESENSLERLEAAEALHKSLLGGSEAPRSALLQPRTQQAPTPASRPAMC